MYASRSFEKACIALATRRWEIWAQQSQTFLQAVEILDLYTAVHQPLQLSLVRGA